MSRTGKGSGVGDSVGGACLIRELFTNNRDSNQCDNGTELREGERTGYTIRNRMGQKFYVESMTVEVCGRSRTLKRSSI